MLEVIILAAGQGTRMKSSLPKVLQPLAGQPLLAHVLQTARQLKPRLIHIVHGHGGDRVKSHFQGSDLNWVEQAEQKGTGHAVQQAIAHVDGQSMVLVLYGDVPLITAQTLNDFTAQTQHLGILSANIAEPHGYGRILRDSQNQVVGIVEQRDASEEQRAITEINTGIMAGKAQLMTELLEKLESDNDQGELYLTDLVVLASQAGIGIDCMQALSEREITGINDKKQLSTMERTKQKMIADTLMEQGVTLLDPARLDVRGELICGQDVEIDINCLVEGRVVLGDRVKVGPNVCLRDSEIGDDSVIKANCVIEGASVGDNAIIGPFARLRPGARLASHVHIGNFVEIKNSNVDEATKINHLTYVGDSDVGKRVNIGAGTITCNYDGANKHKTTIGDDAFIGSGTELVAPINVGKGATTGAGSTLTKDAPENELTIERGQQKSIKGWKRPTKSK